MNSVALETPARRAGRRVVRILAAIVAVVVLIVVGFLVYANMVMHGERAAAIEVWTNPAISVTSTDHSIILAPTGKASDSGLVFIPGAKVDPYAYMFKLSGIVEKSGVTVVITKPTLNLAFFDQRPLSTFTSDVPAVTNWSVGGHSLGGVRACMLADSPDVTGLVLFGSFCANDLSASSVTVLSISGSEDGLSTPAKIADSRHLLPSDAQFTEIKGANHASFGNYGPQSGDGVATITSAQARDEITAALAGFFPAP
jgi:hypothetical protein